MSSIREREEAPGTQLHEWLGIIPDSDLFIPGNCDASVFFESQQIFQCSFPIRATLPCQVVQLVEVLSWDR
jgi:hypothetical protein